MYIAKPCFELFCLLATGIMATVPATFYDAFHGIRADLVDKISPSPTFWNLMLDRAVLTPYHVDKLKVFASFSLFKLMKQCK